MFVYPQLKLEPFVLCAAVRLRHLAFSAVKFARPVSHDISLLMKVWQALPGLALEFFLGLRVANALRLRFCSICHFVTYSYESEYESEYESTEGAAPAA